MRCHRCGEAWDLDTLHDVIKEENPNLREVCVDEDTGRWDQDQYEAVYFRPMVERFNRDGCRAFGQAEWCVEDDESNERAAILSAISDLMGDDIDGVESAIEDAEMWGLL